MTQLIEGVRTPYADEFAQVAAPMTHLRGKRSTIVSEAAWDRAAALRGDVRWVDDDEADHYIPEERPELVADEIARLLPGSSSSTP